MPIVTRELARLEREKLAAHLARAGEHAELGVSVLPAHCGRGIGAARRLLASALGDRSSP